MKKDCLIPNLITINTHEKWWKIKENNKNIMIGDQRTTNEDIKYSAGQELPIHNMTLKIGRKDGLLKKIPELI